MRGVRIYDTSDHWDLAIADLAARSASIEQEVEALRKEDRDLRAKANERLLGMRPSYPSEAFVKGLVSATELVKTGAKFKDHHGAVIFDDQIEGRVEVGNLGERDYRIGVECCAPYNGDGGRLWNFTPEELDEIRKVLEKNQLAILDDWNFGDGWSFRVAHYTHGEFKD